MSPFAIVVASVPDRDRVVAEIWFDEDQWGELSFDDERFHLEIFAPEFGCSWRLDRDTVCDAIAEAKRQLIGDEQ